MQTILILGKLTKNIVFEELDVLRKLIDPLRLDDVISEYGSERDLQEYLGLDESEFEEWKKVWFE